MYGHIPYDVSEELIASPSRMLWFLQEQGYEVQLSPEYEKCRQIDEILQIDELLHEKETHEAELEGVVY